ncbi:hypothetical protein HMPREF1317_0744 [Schaalia georgiae F0490]|uniref:Uncharacterized protein n=1 Tax=Schaalia georgiae F0490 TaxID=1125717 RepID=J0MLY5_9ACTO|nr:hypothetical protein HMPREF1317_0744 [Schaalia georgiae F0490]
MGFGGHPGTFLLAWFNWNDGSPRRARLRRIPPPRSMGTRHRAQRGCACGCEGLDPGGRPSRTSCPVPKGQIRGVL